MFWKGRGVKNVARDIIERVLSSVKRGVLLKGLGRGHKREFKGNWNYVGWGKE